MNQTTAVGARFAEVGAWLAPPRFLAFCALFPVGVWSWHALGHSLAEALDLGFDGAALVFLASLLRMFLTRCDSAAMRAQAARNDANRLLVLGITSTLTVVIMAAIAGPAPPSCECPKASLPPASATKVPSGYFTPSETTTTQ